VAARGPLWFDFVKRAQKPMFHTLLIVGAVGVAGLICFVGLFFRFMRGWNGDLGSPKSFRPRR
jgi:hypothetical protein